MSSSGHYPVATGGAAPEVCEHGGLRRKCEICDLRRQLWWVAQEIRNAADAVDPAPVEAERCLRALADKAERCDVEPWGV